MHTHEGGTNCCVFVSLVNRDATWKGRICPEQETLSFSTETLSFAGAWLLSSKQDIKKLSPFEKMTENTLSVCLLLNYKVQTNNFYLAPLQDIRKLLTLLYF